MIDANWDISRVQLSRRVCEGLKWRSRNGRLKEVNCRKVLSRLGREGKIRLPEAKRFGGNRKARKEAEVVAAETVKSGDLKDQWIGWSGEIREKNLNQVVGNSRFLIVPLWRVPHLASHVLGL